MRKRSLFALLSVLIFATFDSLPQTVLIMTILPFSMVGGVAVDETPDEP